MIESNRIEQDFQQTVAQYLLRHHSILDALSKFQEQGARANRALVKAVTRCGCVKIRAEKQKYPDGVPLAQVKDHLSSHLEGSLCENCQEVVEQEIGSAVFYLAGVCFLMGIDFNDVLRKELERISTLGYYSLT